MICQPDESLEASAGGTQLVLQLSSTLDAASKNRVLKAWKLLEVSDEAVQSITKPPMDKSHCLAQGGRGERGGEGGFPENPGAGRTSE